MRAVGHGGKPQGGIVIFRLRRALRQSNPDIVQGWLYHGNVAATVSTLFWDNAPPVLWNIRGSLATGKRFTNLLVWLSAKISFLPYKIINNSTASALEHEQRLGFRTERRVVLPNGFDTEMFRPSANSRRTVRQSLGISDDAIVIGLLGRYHPIKDHENFLAAAGVVRDRHPNVHFVLAGEGVDETNAALRELVLRHGLHERAQLLGLRSDVAELMCSLDLLVCSSWGEGFPNVVGEAMSCGVPCVVTDVGDCREVVGDTGRTVPPRDSSALAQGILDLIAIGSEGRAALGARARQRVIESFSLEAVVRRYEDLYAHVHAQSIALRQRV
jgi:glycosyltransferase involved in cell wall biosynthesis